ncbi:MAG: helix-turn-helix domain-containing protein [Polynucleobacter sp.]
MTNHNDIPEILGAEFTRARERAGLSTIDLAKMASLTTSHVEQIENGESSSFYSPAIKFVAAKKLASFLGLPETECFVYPEGVVTKSTKIQAAVGEADLTNKVHVSIAKENFDKLLLATQELDNKKSKFYKKPSFYFLAILLLAGVFASAFARADIVGVMPAYGERLVITSETCKWDNGREEPNWLFAYFESAFGVVNRACYIRYNNQIWLRRATGVEMVFPAEYFKQPNASIETVKN